MKNKTSVRANLSDDVLCALIARDKLRKRGLTVAGSTGQFLEIFHEYSDLQKGKTDKQTAELEKQRKLKIAYYIDEHLAIKDNNGAPTDAIVTE